MCALEELRDGLRRRDVYVTPSERFADARSSLLSDAAWDASREDTCRALSLPTEPDAFIEQLAADADDAYQRTREELTPEHAIHDLAARGELPVERLDALPEPPSLIELRGRVDALMPPADLPDLVLETRSRPGFSTRSPTTRNPTRSCAMSRSVSARSSSRRPATSATGRSLTRATRRCANHAYATSRSATCAPTRSPQRTPGSSTTTPSSRSPSAGAAARSPRSTGCASSSQAHDSRRLQPPLLRPPPRHHRTRRDRRPLRRPADDRDPRHPARRPVRPRRAA
jgi:hypothetical protein